MSRLRVSALLLLSLVVGGAADARETLGQRFSELELTDGSVVRDVRLMSYSAAQRGVVIAVNRQLRVLPLTQLPEHLRRGVLADYDDERVRPVPNVVTTVRPSSAAPQAAIPTPQPSVSPSHESTLDLLKKQAATEAPDELRFHLQKMNTRVASLDCKIRSVEQVQGWQRIRVTGVASFSIWNHHDRDYVWRTGKFEVVFDIVSGEQLEADTVTFDGISSRVED